MSPRIRSFLISIFMVFAITLIGKGDGYLLPFLGSVFLGAALHLLDNK